MVGGVGLATQMLWLWLPRAFRFRVSTLDTFCVFAADLKILRMCKFQRNVCPSPPGFSKNVRPYLFQQSPILSTSPSLQASFIPRSTNASSLHCLRNGLWIKRNSAIMANLKSRVMVIHIWRHCYLHESRPVCTSQHYSRLCANNRAFVVALRGRPACAASRIRLLHGRPVALCASLWTQPGWFFFGKNVVR